MIGKGLATTALLWPPIRMAFGWVHQAAHLLGLENETGAEVRQRLSPDFPDDFGFLARGMRRNTGIPSVSDHFLPE